MEIEMQLSEQAQAILLLTAWLGKHDHANAAPLSPVEWGRFALFLRDAGHNPAGLLQSSDLNALLSGFEDRKITAERISRLLERSAALSISVEKWERAGLWILTRSDADYPRRWKQKLKNNAPPVLFGAGNRTLLNREGIAVVGSRELTADELTFTEHLGREIAFQGKVLISGGARGADETGMLGALASDGTAVGVMADSLLRASTSAKYRNALMRNDLCLVSPFNPEAGFNAGNAMARNKYIYCLSDAAVVIAATENKGGTWAGAMENLSKRWVPLWVRQGDVSGNHALVQNGAGWLPDILSVEQLTMGNGEGDELAFANRVVNQVEHHAPYGEHARSIEPALDENQEVESSTLDWQDGTGLIANRDPEPEQAAYAAFLQQLSMLLREDALSLKELQQAFELKPRKLSDWLKKAISDGTVVKTRSPVTYRIRSVNEAAKRADEGDVQADEHRHLSLEKRIQSNFKF
jgi:predicted Rossmann fold nucleotide-binding protein DprA/Smf involved in DNA uptake